MAIDPATTDVVTILGLAQHPTITPDQTNRERIHLGVDSEVGATSSYRISLEDLRTALDISSGSEISINVPGHGITLLSGFPRPVFSNNLGAPQVATAASLATLQTYYVTEITDANNIKVQQSGPVSVPSHGLTVGAYYYLQSNGSVGTSPDSLIDSRCWYVLDDDTFLLQHVREKEATSSGITFIDDLELAVSVGSMYRLREDQLIGGVTYTSGVYMVDEGGTVVQLHQLPGITEAVS